MRFLAGLFLLAFALLSCEPDRFDPGTYGTIEVWVSPQWSNNDKTRIADALLLLHRLGPAFHVTEDSTIASVVILPFESTNCVVTGAGRWRVGSRVAEIDPVCTPGDTAFRTVTNHEVLHVLGLEHVCQRAGGPDCSPVGYGPAIMNPELSEGADPLDPVPFTDVPTRLDFAEWDRVRRTVSHDAGRD